MSPNAISIIVPVYNGGQCLLDCLSALKTEGCPDSEIIVVDDGSTDNSADLALELGARVLRLSENGGPSVARNHGVRQARGDILFFVDADVVVMAGAVNHVL